MVYGKPLAVKLTHRLFHMEQTSIPGNPAQTDKRALTGNGQVQITKASSILKYSSQYLHNQRRAIDLPRTRLNPAAGISNKTKNRILYRWCNVVSVKMKKG
jgi:hypothetical protein